jgi:hypothetical protein
MGMRSRHRPRLRLGWAGGLAAAWGLLQMGCTAYPATPAQPAFDTDVLPIFEAHCTRCHGAGPDGGALNAADIPGMGVLQASGPCLMQYGTNPSSYCQGGAAVYTDKIHTYIQPGYSLRMPPPPAPELNSWELDVVESWLAEPCPQICSRSSNPDPSLYCPTPANSLCM